MRARHGLTVFALAFSAASQPSAAPGVVLHEPIASDPRDDLAQAVSLDGNLPAAIDTSSGIVGAPDPRRPIGSDRPSDAPFDLAGRPFEIPPNATFTPDSDTHRPDVLPYEDPFTPSTAPFKRLLAFDAVTSSFGLTVHDDRQVQTPIGQPVAADGSEEPFYGDMVVDLDPAKRARVPSVGPGAKVLRARAGIGPSDVAFQLFHDGADNWFVQGDRAARVRFVVEMSIARATFGGDFADPAWSDLKGVAPLPPNVAEDANKVALVVGASRAQSPRENVERLVAYFRSFVDSDVPPTGHGNIYLDLALSRKGVCRHRAYAFLVTALGLGIPTRMVMNEAHAWVEVNDGSLWRRIDLGGAGRALSENAASDIPYDPPPDPFAWPPDATRGEDLVQRGRLASGQPGQGHGSPALTPPTIAPTPADDVVPVLTQRAPLGNDAKVSTLISVAVVDVDVRRGRPVHVHGSVRADGEACTNVVVDLILRDANDPSRQHYLGALATNGDGAFAGELVVPTGTPLGDYEVIARTPGATQCAAGGTP